MKRLVNATFDEAGADGANSVASPKSNCQTVIDAIIDEADRDLSAAGNSFDGLKAHARGGQRLGELKTHLDHGSFDRVVQARLGIKRAWRAKLMKVGREWPDIVIAIEWANANNSLTRSDYSVDGALSLLATWRRETANGDNSGAADENSPAGSYVANKTISKKKLVEQLELVKQFAMKLLLELIRARRRIAFLESEIERLSGSPDMDMPPEEQLMLPLPEHMQ